MTVSLRPRKMVLLVVACIAMWASASGDEPAPGLASLVDDFMGARNIIQFTYSCTAAGYGATARSLSPGVQYHVVSCGSCNFLPSSASRQIHFWDGGSCDTVGLTYVVTQVGTPDLVLDDFQLQGFKDQRKRLFSATWPLVSPGGTYALASQSELLKMAMDGVRCAAPCESPALKCTSFTCMLRKTSEPPFSDSFHFQPGSEAEKASAQFWATNRTFLKKFWPARVSEDEPTAPMVGTTNLGEFRSTPFSAT
jgi:hypothetical protein